MMLYNFTRSEYRRSNCPKKVQLNLGNPFLKPYGGLKCYSMTEFSSESATVHLVVSALNQGNLHDSQRSRYQYFMNH